tara:strand:+ start:646 stop:852 length:207 start_codon:yes stop_codon:yes gene_type:complete
VNIFRNKIDWKLYRLFGKETGEDEAYFSDCSANVVRGPRSKPSSGPEEGGEARGPESGRCCCRLREEA